MTHLVAYLPNGAARDRFARVMTTIASTVTVAHVDSWSELHTTLGNSTCRIAVVDPFAGSTVESSRLGVLRRTFPAVTLVLYGRFHAHDWRTLLQLVRLGVQHVVALDVDDDPARLRATLVAALDESRAQALLDEVRDLVPARLQCVVDLLARKVDESWSPARLAAACGCHPKTLREYLRLAGLPSTHRLVTWFRLFAAAQLLADREKTIQQVANALRFPSADAMRVQMHRYIGRAPSDLRAGDALPLLLGAFRQECASRRAAGPSAVDRLVAGLPPVRHDLSPSGS